MPPQGVCHAPPLVSLVGGEHDTPILFGALSHQLRVMAKATLGYVPFIGWHLARSGHLLVNRKNPGAASS